MTQEEKDLLLKDLCARIPYGVMLCEDYYEHKRTLSILDCGVFFIIDHTDKVKPYLRQMSSMTEEEMKEYNLLTPIVEVVFPCDAYPLTDWLNKKHFDYRGLIHMGLALEAPEGMYKS